MAPLYATPAAVVIPHGIDAMVDPPPTSSHSRQPEWLRRHYPPDYVPPFLLSSLALEASRGYKAGYPTSCITGTRLGDACVLLSTAGPARDLISLTQVPLQPPTLTTERSRNNAVNNRNNVDIDAVSLAQLASSGYKPWYTRAHAPILQLALNFSPPGCWSTRTLENGPDAPILAARSATSVEFWPLEQQREHVEQYINQQEEETEEERQSFLITEDSSSPVGGGRSVREDENEADRSRNRNVKWKFKEESLGIISIPPSTTNTLSVRSTTTTADVAWCHHIPTRCVVLTTNGCLFDVAVDSTKNIRRGTRNTATTTTSSSSSSKTSIEAPIGWAPSLQLLSDLPFLGNTAATTSRTPSSSPSSYLNYNKKCISLRCAFTANHPRHVLVSLHSRLGTVDLRGGIGSGGCRNGFSQDIYTCPPGQWISALATSSAPSSSSSLPASHSHYVAASTATEILLFDLRRPHAVLASWEHSMTAEGKVKDVDAMYAAVPDTLTWLPPHINTSGVESRISSNSSGAGAGGGGGPGPSSIADPVVDTTATKVSDHSYQLIASNSFHGKAIVCEWDEHRARGGIAAAKKGVLWEYPLSKISKLTSAPERNKNNKVDKSGVEADQDLDNSSSDEDDELDLAEYSFEPACWTDIQPEQPPRLLFAMMQGFPGSLAGAVKVGKNIQKHRAMIAATGKEYVSIATGGEVSGRIEQEEEEEEGGFSLQQQQQQQQQQQRAVRLLPSPWTGPEFLGISSIPLQQDWKSDNTELNSATPRNRTDAVVGGGSGSGGGCSAGGKTLIAMLSPTQELILAQLDSVSTLPNSSNMTRGNMTPPTIPTATTTTTAPVLPILNPIEPALPTKRKERIDPGSSVEEIRVDSSGRIIEDPQSIFAKEAAAGVLGAGHVVASTVPPGGGDGVRKNSREEDFAFKRGVVKKKKGNIYPQFNVKQPVYVGLSLHKWMFEESIRQYEVDPEEYQATFPFPPLEEHQQEEEEHGPHEESEPSLHDFRHKIHSSLLTSARVPFTAAEAWTALTSSPSQERNSMVFQGITPSRPGGSRKKRATHSTGGSGNSSSNAGAAYSPSDAFLTALTRAGVVPLPPHIRAIPEKESNSTGLGALQSQTAFFPPLPAFMSILKESGGGGAPTTLPPTTIEDGSTNVEHKLSVSTLNYRKKQLKAFAPPITTGTAAGDGAAGSLGQGTSQRREIGLQLHEIAPSEIDTRGHNVVFTPIGQDAGAGTVPSVHSSRAPSKPPSAAAQTVLNKLNQDWERINSVIP